MCSYQFVPSSLSLSTPRSLTRPADPSTVPLCRQHFGATSRWSGVSILATIPSSRRFRGRGITVLCLHTENRSKSKKERSFFKTDRRRRINYYELRRGAKPEFIRFDPCDYWSSEVGETTLGIEIRGGGSCCRSSGSKLVVFFFNGCFFSKGESDLCVVKAGEVCLLQGRATSWTTGPRCLCIRTCALSPYVCSR